MKLIYLHQYFNTPDMSGGTRSYEIARHMVAQGHEVHMVTSDRRNKVNGWCETVEEGIRVHWYPIEHSASRSYHRRIRAFFGFAWAAARRVASLSGDLVFATSTPLTIALPAVFAAKKHSVPMVFEVRDLWPEVPIAMGVLRSRIAIAAARRLEQFAYRNAAHIVALAPGMKEGVVAAGYPADQVTVIPNMCNPAHFRVDPGIGVEFRRARDWLHARPLVVFTGALGVANGVDYLARLASVVWQRDPEIRFLIVGSEKEEDHVRKIARQLDVLNRNFFMQPAVSKSEMPAILSAADLASCVFLNMKEFGTNSPNKVFDALAAGRPVAINYHHGWIADMIRETQCGLILDPQNLDLAANELIAKVRSRSWLDDAGAAAARLAEERFNRDRLVRQWEEIMVNVVREHQQNQLVLPMTGRRIAHTPEKTRRAA